MTLSCFFLDSWENLVMAIGRIVRALVLDDVVVYLLLEEVRLKSYEPTNPALVVCGRSNEKGKKREKGRSKSYGRHKSPGNSKEKRWNCCKVRYFIRYCKEEKNKNKKENNDSKDEFENYSQEDGGDAFVSTLTTRASQSAWLIYSRFSFHKTSHRN